MHPILLDAAGHRRQPVTLPGYHAGRPPRNKGRRYPADPPTVEEIIAVMRTAGAGPDGVRLRALIVVLWRAGLRIGEALALAETDLDARRGAVLVRHGKGDKRREVGMDSWAWEQLEPWQQLPRPIPGRTVVLRDPRPDRRAQLGAGVRAPPTGPDRRRRGSQASVRASISSATRTRSRWRTNGSRCRSSSANSGMPISGSPRSISKGSTTLRSSTPSTPDDRRSSRPPPVCAPRRSPRAGTAPEPDPSRQPRPRRNDRRRLDLVRPPPQTASSPY